MIPISRVLTEEVAAKLRSEIAESQGAEIFAVLHRDADRPLFSEITVIARGTGVEVPALLSRANWGDMTVHNHPSGELRPSEADMRVATIFGEEGVGSMIVNNQVTHTYVVVEPAADVQTVELAATQVSDVFVAEGPLSKQLEGYETREGQVKMALHVSQALNRGDLMTVEAGTGTGKSLAYLVPSMMWVQANKKRVVIATKTIALQEQLVYKDIPIAKTLMPDPPHAALIKGRSNYVCLRKLQDVVQHQLSLFGEEEDGAKQEIKELADWVTSHEVGDRADLPYLPSRRAWESIQSDSDMCLGAKCPHFQRSPFYVSRRLAAKARILVVNQALLFADLAVRQSTGNHKAAAVIPPYDVVILDEAHSIEDIATDHFAMKISSFGLRLALGKLISARGASGVIVRLSEFVMREGKADLSAFLSETIPQIRESQERVFQAVEAMAAELHAALNPEEAKRVEIWLNERTLNSGRLAESKNMAQELMIAISVLLHLCKRIRRKLTELDDAFAQKIEGQAIELDARISRIENMTAALKDFAVKHDPAVIPWVELRRFRNGRPEFDYKVSPLDISEMLQKALFKPYHSVLMTSATLDLNDDFAFFAERVGLKDYADRKPVFLQVNSPFSYADQARLVVPDLGLDPDHPGFAKRIAELVIELAETGHGGTLVLFTSYSLLNRVADACSGPLSLKGIELLVQGHEQRSVLLNRLKQGMGVLLGTDSFWEGVDLPGLALSKLVLTKLPFPQVNDPIFAARSEAIRLGGSHPFASYALPLALLKFKQGAGRLIRSRVDEGILFVTDRRILHKSYGGRFLRQLEQYPLYREWPIPGNSMPKRL